MHLPYRLMGGLLVCLATLAAAETHAAGKAYKLNAADVKYVKRLNLENRGDAEECLAIRVVANRVAAVAVGIMAARASNRRIDTAIAAMKTTVKKCDRPRPSSMAVTNAVWARMKIREAAVAIRETHLPAIAAYFGGESLEYLKSDAGFAEFYRLVVYYTLKRDFFDKYLRPFLLATFAAMRRGFKKWIDPSIIPSPPTCRPVVVSESMTYSEAIARIAPEARCYHYATRAYDSTLRFLEDLFKRHKFTAFHNNQRIVDFCRTQRYFRRVTPEICHHSADR